MITSFSNTIVCLTAGLLALAVFRIIGKDRKRYVYILTALDILLCVGVAEEFFPAENVFYKFESAEQAFTHYEKGEFIKVIEGSSSGLVKYKTDDATGTAVFPKSKDGTWKIQPFLYNRTVYRKNVQAGEDGCAVTVYNAKGTDDFYVEVTDFTSDNKAVVSDNRGSDFWCYEESEAPQMKVYSFYTCVEKLDGNYQFTINDKTVTVKLGDKDFSEII